MGRRSPNTSASQSVALQHSSVFFTSVNITNPAHFRIVLEDIGLMSHDEAEGVEYMGCDQNGHMFRVISRCAEALTQDGICDFDDDDLEALVHELVLAQDFNVTKTMVSPTRIATDTYRVFKETPTSDVKITRTSSVFNVVTGMVEHLVDDVPSSDTVASNVVSFQRFTAV